MSSSLGARVYLPLSVAWLEQLSFGFSARKHKRSVQYVLSAEHLPSGRRWAVPYAFDDCRVFQRRLARALCVGHRCEAPCPWLFSFVSSYFPKPRLFRSATSDQLVRQRCEALGAYVKTLQSVLLSRASHSCSVLLEPVADALLEFICGGNSEQFPIRQWAFAGQQHRARGSVHSLTTTSDENDDPMQRSFRSNCSFTDCASFLETTASTTTITSDTESPNDESKLCELCSEAMTAVDKHWYYTTRLRCGHRFHDECLVEHLNIDMSCPTCAKPVTNDA